MSGLATAAGRLRAAGSRRPVIAGFLLLALGLCAYALVRERDGVREALSHLTVPAVAEAFAGVLAALGAALMQWRAVLADLGSRLAPRAAGRVFYLGQLGKYLPGSVWAALGQMELAKAHAVPRSRSMTAYAVTMLTTLIAAFVAAAALLPFAAPAQFAAYRWFVLAVPLGVVALSPRVLNPTVNLLLRVMHRPPLDRPVSARGIALASLWALAGWVGYGLQIWALSCALGAPPGRGLPVAVGGFALAWSVGFLVVFAPAGAGAREAVMAAILSAVLPVADALIVVLVSRLLMTLGDLLTAGVAVAVTRRGPRGRPTAHAPGADAP